jgi:uncharacterized membrane protein
MADTPQFDGLQTTPDERTMATLAHALQMIGSWIAPLIIFLIRRESRFVAFHALQALLLQILHVLVVMLFVGGFFITMIFYVMPNGAHQPAEFPWPVFVLFPLIWIAFAVLSIGTLAIAIIYSIKAGRGEWADYPVLGKLARKILKMGPRPLP